MSGGTADDGARWAMALSLVEDAPAEGAGEGLRRARRKRVLLVVGATLLVLGVALLVALLLLDGGGDSRNEDTPAWAEVIGGGLQLLGGVLLIVYCVLFWRMLRRSEAWRSPVDVLTFRQRRELVHQVRGRVPVVPERIPLVRAQAALLLDQWAVLVLFAAAMLNFVGRTLRDPEPWRLVASGGLAAVFLGAVVLIRRDAARARRFLEQHPVSPGAGS